MALSHVLLTAAAWSPAACSLVVVGLTATVSRCLPFRTSLGNWPSCAAAPNVGEVAASVEKIGGVTVCACVDDVRARS